MSVLKVLLVRHAQSRGNAEGRMEGWQSSLLTAIGERQAAQLGQFLAAASWVPTHIYCSPLQRATETLKWMMAGFQGQGAVQTLANSATEPFLIPDSPVVNPSASGCPQIWSLPARQVSIAYCDDLKEYRHGIFDGMTWGEARNHYPDLCHQLETNLDWLPIPEAETLTEGFQRACNFVDQLLASHGNGDGIWVVSHQWLLQQLVARLLGCDRTWGIPMANTAVFELHLDRDRWNTTSENRYNSDLWQLRRFNDCEHLRGLL